jgi:hypothetical protein
MEPWQGTTDHIEMKQTDLVRGQHTMWQQSERPQTRTRPIDRDTWMLEDPTH